MQAAVLMYVDARPESGAGALEMPWARWRVSRKDAGAAASRERKTELHKRPSAAAMALARKRQRKRQQELGDSASEASNEPDDEEDEEEITAFVEYNASDMDSLDINLSQDFDGEISVRGDAESYRRRPQPLDHTQDDSEEASEVFDNVIYAPLPPLAKPAAGASTVSKSSFPPPPPVQTEAKPIPQQSPAPEEDEDSLSDGLDVDPEFVNSLKQDHKASPRQSTSTSSSNQLLWRQRRSIKRDCTFVDTDSIADSSYMSSASRQNCSTLRSSIKVIELGEDEDDADSIKSIEACSLAEPQAGSSRASSACNSPATSTSLVLAGHHLGLQPPLQMKRRKVEHQLTLDGFFRCRPFK